MQGKIYNRSTKRYIADTPANRKRLGLKPKPKKVSRKGSKKVSRKGSKKASRKGSKKAPRKGSKKASKPTKGNCSCSYKGDEPSPKGHGYCAHCGKAGDSRVGTDGNKWVIKVRRTGSRFWAKKK